MFRIMSFNVLCYGREPHFWTLRAPLVCRLIRETLPDSFGVQEAHIDWINALTEGLPEYDYVGVGRNDGKEDGEFAAVFYLKDKFTASDSGSACTSGRMLLAISALARRCWMPSSWLS